MSYGSTVELTDTVTICLQVQVPWEGNKKAVADTVGRHDIDADVLLSMLGSNHHSFHHRLFAADELYSD